jgi:hypothetical protein
MIARPVLAEVLQDVCERRFRHLDLQKIVAHGNLLDFSLFILLRHISNITMLSLAPDSPRNDRGSSLTPS